MLNLKCIWNYKVLKATKIVLKKKSLEGLGLDYIAGYQDLANETDSFPYNISRKEWNCQQTVLRHVE